MKECDNSTIHHTFSSIGIINVTSLELFKIYTVFPVIWQKWPKYVGASKNNTVLCTVVLWWFLIK